MKKSVSLRSRRKVVAEIRKRIARTARDQRRVSNGEAKRMQFTVSYERLSWMVDDPEAFRRWVQAVFAKVCQLLTNDETARRGQEFMLCVYQKH